MSEEIWRDIPGFEGHHQASSLGRVRSLDRVRVFERKRLGRAEIVRLPCKGKILAPCKIKKYLFVRLVKDGVARLTGVHSCVCAAFAGPRPQGLDCAHLNGDPTDNRPENLAWATRAENVQQSRAHGVHPKGERHGNSSLTEEAVREIRRLSASGLAYKAISRRLKISYSNARRVARGEGWGHVA